MTHIAEPCVRETSQSAGLADWVLDGAMYRSLRFNQVMANGDTCDYVASYADTFEEGTCTLVAGGTYGTLQRTSQTRCRHASGAVNTTKVTFAAGIKQIIMTVSAYRSITLRNAIRFDVAQGLNTTQQAIARANVPPFEPGVYMLFHLNAAPVLWTRYFGYHDRALRIVTGNMAAGGVWPFSSVFSRTTTDYYTLSQSEIPGHQHTGATGGVNADHVHAYTIASSSGAQKIGGGGSAPLDSLSGTSTGGISSDHAHGFTSDVTGGGAAHFHPMDIRLQYLDMMMASKD